MTVSLSWDFFTISSLCHKLSPTHTPPQPQCSHVPLLFITPTAFQVQHIMFHMVQMVSSGFNFDELKLNLFFVLFYWLKLLTSEGGETIGIHRESAQLQTPKHVTYYSLKIKTLTNTRTHSPALVACACWENRPAKPYTMHWTHSQALVAGACWQTGLAKSCTMHWTHSQALVAGACWENRHAKPYTMHYPIPIALGTYIRTTTIKGKSRGGDNK